MERESFIFYRSFWESIKDLPRDIQGEVLTAIIEYGLYGATTENPKPIAGAIFTLIKPVIDANNKRFINGQKGAEFGTLGGRPKKQNPNETPTKPQQNPNKTPNIKEDINNTNSIHNSDTNCKRESEQKISFVQITDLNGYLKNYQGDKGNLFIAYRFWELWHEQSPNNQTLVKADATNWSNEIKKLLKFDKTSVDRLIGIYTYFSECAKGKAGFDDFWFKTIKSIAGLRKKNKYGEYYIDRIIDKVNDQIQADRDFENLVFTNIEKFKHYATKH